MKVLIISFERFPENAATNSETNDEALYDRRFAQIKYSRNDETLKMSRIRM